MNLIELLWVVPCHVMLQLAWCCVYDGGEAVLANRMWVGSGRTRLEVSLRKVGPQIWPQMKHVSCL